MTTPPASSSSASTTELGADARPLAVVVIGPTASGKTGLALELAGRLTPPAEIVAMDSMQVYRGMDIGTAKPTAAERGETPHHVLDVVEPTEPFTVEQWLSAAEASVAAIRGRGRTPVLVGGTHLYAKAFLEGLFQGPAADPALRASLEAMPTGERRAELERVDPAAAARIHPNDTRRTVRALEVHRLTGTPISEQQREWDRGAVRADARVVVLRWPTEELNRRINQRVREMVEAGLVEEARGLWEAGRLGETASQALGYKQLIEHFEGRRSLSEAVERIKIETRRFAKNQRTWLRRLSATPGAVVLDAERTPTDRWADEVLGALGGGRAGVG